MKVYEFESLFFDIGYCISVNLVVVYIILIFGESSSGDSSKFCSIF